MTTMSKGSGVMTAEELIRLPRGRWRYELVRGELREMTPAGHLHGKIAADVLSRMAVFVREHQLGVTYAAETGFYLRRNPDTVRAADASFVGAARLASMTLSPDGYFPGAPDLAIEVISPSDTYSEVDEKVGEWLDAGCLAVVILDPRRKTGTVHRPGGDPVRLAETDVLSLPDLLPGWSLLLGEIW
jgi:Uma2 family endonuclease